MSTDSVVTVAAPAATDGHRGGPADDSRPTHRTAVLVTALGGMFLVRVGEQFPSVTIADIQGRVAATPDEASWILTAYTMAAFVAIVLSGVLIRALGLGRYLIISSVVFSIASLGCALAPDLDLLVVFRVVQGFASGGFGPAAFAAAFTIGGGARLPATIAWLAFALLFPTTCGPILAGLLESAFGWEALFTAQAAAGVLIAVIAVRVTRRDQPVWSALSVDWAAITLLALALALTALVLSQGTRRFWLESDLVYWCSAAALGAAAGFVVSASVSPRPLIRPGLLITRRFGIPNAINLVFRAVLVVTSYLVPQFLSIVHGYRSLDLAWLLVWSVVPQAIALPLVWWLLGRLDARWIMVAGLALCATSTAMLTDASSLASADQMRLPLLVFGFGEVLFLIPAITVGSTSLSSADLPTASLAFNVTTLGGGALGTALGSHLLTEREKLHSNTLTEVISLYSPWDSIHVERLASLLANRSVDDVATTNLSAAVVATAARREAWVLAFNDVYLLLTAVLVVVAIAAIGIGRVSTRHSGASRDTAESS